MIISKTVLIHLHGNNIQYFRSLGYSIPNIVKKNTYIQVKVSDLPPESSVKVLYECDVCKNHFEVIYRNLYKNKNFVRSRKTLCKKCAMNTDFCIKALSNSHTGTHHSEKSKKKMIEHNWMKGKFGPLHPRWKLIKTHRYVPGYDQWKQKVKERDNYTCQKCGSKKNPQAHHINSVCNFKDQIVILSNGITLCKDCHKTIHKKFGHLTTKESLELFI